MMEERSAKSWRDHAADAEAWEREHEEEWERVDQKLRGIAARRAAMDAEEARLLRYAEELKLWRAYGYGSGLEYMERVMGYAPHTASERLRVARALAELPMIEEALERGELAHSAVRELSRVAIAGTEAVWLEAAHGKSLREIEAMVSGHKPGDLPTDETEPRLHRRTITIELSPETYDLWRQMHALAAEEHGQRLSDDELIPSLFRKAYGEGGRSDGAPAYKIALKQCPDCKRAWQYGGGREIEVDPAVIECASCDATHLGSLDAAVPERTTTTVTPRKREQVLARDGHCCTVPGCRRNTGLDLHHIEHQSRGGGHELWNLTTLCSLHHQSAHYGKLSIRGIAPDSLAFEFRRPRDRRNVTDDDAPEHISSTRAAASARRPSSPHGDAATVQSHVEAASALVTSHASFSIPSPAAGSSRSQLELACDPVTSRAPDLSASFPRPSSPRLRPTGESQLAASPGLAHGRSPHRETSFSGPGITARPVAANPRSQPPAAQTVDPGSDPPPVVARNSGRAVKNSTVRSS